MQKREDKALINNSIKEGCLSGKPIKNLEKIIFFGVDTWLTLFKFSLKLLQIDETGVASGDQWFIVCYY